MSIEENVQPDPGQIQVEPDPGQIQVEPDPGQIQVEPVPVEGTPPVEQPAKKKTKP